MSEGILFSTSLESLIFGLCKNYRCLILLSVVSKIFEKHVRKRLFDAIGKCGYFSDFQYDFRSSRLTANQLTVIGNRISRAFDMSSAIPAI